MSAKTKRLTADLLALAEQHPGGWQNKMQTMYKQFEQALHVDARALSAVRLRVEEVRRGALAEKAARRDYQRLNYERERIVALIVNAKWVEQVRQAWDADKGDPDLVELWQTFGPAELKKKESAFSLFGGEKGLTREIESVDLTTDLERKLAEIEQGIGRGVSELLNDVTRVGYALTAAQRDPQSPLRNVGHPQGLLEQYFEFSPASNGNGMQIKFLREDIDPNYDGQAEQDRLDLQEQLTAELAQARDAYAQTNRYANFGSDAYMLERDARANVARIEEKLRSAGMEIPANPYQESAVENA